MTLSLKSLQDEVNTVFSLSMFTLVVSVLSVAITIDLTTSTNHRIDAVEEVIRDNRHELHNRISENENENTRRTCQIVQGIKSLADQLGYEFQDESTSKAGFVKKWKAVLHDSVMQDGLDFPRPGRF